ncbi:MAG: RNA polymerase sigma factor [Lachnospiraceae bacterium]|nr:RNA polymerase sigma factor [Lachnospiraceae bacterium]
MKLLTAKEQTLLQQLYETYRERLVNYADVMLHNRADAEDVVQDCFLYVLERPGSLKGVDSPETYHYLSVITKHKALDLIRKKNRLAAEEEAAEESYEMEAAESLSPALNAMAPRAREMLLLRYADEISVREIARMYGMQEAAVRQALHRAKKELKARLAEEDEDDK